MYGSTIAGTDAMIAACTAASLVVQMIAVCTAVSLVVQMIAVCTAVPLVMQMIAVCTAVSLVVQMIAVCTAVCNGPGLVQRRDRQKRNSTINLTTDSGAYY